MQIQNLEREIQEKQRQMRAIEQLIIESGEASIANASLVEMQQVFNLHISFTGEHDLGPRQGHLFKAQRRSAKMSCSFVVFRK